MVRRPPRLPSVHTAGRMWGHDELTRRAGAWRAAIDRLAGGENQPVAIALSPTADAVALFAAVTSRPTWTVLLPADSQLWPDSLQRRPGLPVVLPPLPLGEPDGAVRRTIAPATIEGVTLLRRAGHPVHVLDAHLPRGDGTEPRLLGGDGVVLFTSGSTGAPRPVFRPMSHLVAAVTARLNVLDLRDDDGLVVGASLAHGHGVTRLVSALVLGGRLGLLDPLDHRSALGMLSEPGFAFWSATAHFADLLGRCDLTGPAVVPRVCLLSSPVIRTVFDRFHDRFGIPLRQNYSSSETASIAVDADAPDRVDPETVGRPLPGVELRFGESPDCGDGDGREGRLWVRSPWLMAGYGFPPDVERPGMIDGWWPTRDIAARREDGRLMLLGRVDDCVRTREGRLVNLGVVASSLRQLDVVDDAVVVPLEGATGASFGAVIACQPSITMAALRTRITSVLPSWGWPRALVRVESLPRLANGKIDRRGCISLVQREGYGTAR